MSITSEPDARTVIPAQRRRLARLRAMFDPDDVPQTVVDDLAGDPLNRTFASGYAQLAVVGFWTVARRLPMLVRTSLVLAAAASRRRTVLMLSMQAVAGVCQAVGLFATTNVLASLFRAGTTPDRVVAALPALAVIAAFTAVQAAANGVASMLSSQITPRMDANALMRLQELCTQVELEAFDQAGWMDDESRAERGAVSPKYLLQATVKVMRGAITIGSATAVLALISPLLLPLLLVTIAPQMWASVRMARLEYKVWIRQIEGRRRQNIIAQLGQNLYSAADVRSLSLSAYLVSRYRRLSELYLAEGQALTRAESLSQMAGDALSGIAMGGVYVTLFLLLWNGWLPLATGGTAFIAIGRAQSALQNLVSYANSIYAEGLYLDGYQSFIARAESHLPPAATADTPAGFKEIAVEDVTFRYAGAERAALEGASFTITAGTVVALVGENGAAKTTLAKLLGRLYLPESGQIRWDGVDIATVDADLLRAQIAFIAQDQVRFPLSARENIRIGAWMDSQAHDRVPDSARRAGAEEFIAGLPSGYDTLMDRSLTSGTGVSGGQWQRMALARGIIKDAALVIADEPTSHLDAAAEIEFYRSLRDYGGTVILVSHRMNAVRSCADVIVVIEGGRIAAMGTHDELMADADGWYRRAFTLQQNSFNADAIGS